MSNRKLAKVIEGFLKDLWKSFRAIPKSFVNWLLRTVLAANRRSRMSGAGFILPTTVLLVLVVALTVGALTFRAYNRNAQVIGESQQRVIYNAATPTIDRARSKLEFLFDPSKDTRYPGGVPSESRLLSMLLNDGSGGLSAIAISGTDPYILPDEKRVDLGGPNGSAADNAWSYRTDTNGDGKNDATVIYSIIFKAPDPSGGKNTQQKLIEQSDKDKASALFVRHGPLSQEDSTIRCTSQSGRITTEDGWFQEPSNSAVLRKNFQVDTYVLRDDPNGTAVTLEFNQDRQLDRGNKWGAWFRNDLEIFPGPAFNWNGAMHTEGSLFLGNSAIKAYLISSTSSCLFYEAASEISITDKSPDFLGHVFVGKVGDNDNGGSAAIDVQTGAKTVNEGVGMDKDKDSTTTTAPSQILADPTMILVSDGYKSKGTDPTNKTGTKWVQSKLPVVAGSDFKNRFLSKSQVAPYVDDLYRADDRWGPKPRYKPGADIAGQYSGAYVKTPDKIGDPIAQSSLLTSSQKDALIAATPSVGAAEAAVGLDGYWERRARNEGMRILVGQRLELGNLNTWITPRDIDGDNYIDDPGTGQIAATDEREGDPLYPPTVRPYPTPSSTARVKHLDLQRRTLRDNASAVQSTAVYHKASGSKDFPVACLATTAHPGTLTTLKQSINFFPTTFKNGQTANDTTLVTDFFTGRGTNGWEFTPPANDETDFANKLAAGQPFRLAMNNLANFAADPDGEYPFDLSVAQGNGGRIRPYPALTMWGNYSNLRKALENLDASGYANLSIADKTYLHTAACTLGMLAYEIDTIQKFDPSNKANDGSSRVLSSLADSILQLMDGNVANGEVLPKGQLGTYNYDPAATTVNPGGYKPQDYYNVPPEVFIGKLKESFAAAGGGLNPTFNDARLRMAELIMLNQQVRRDRTYGFRPSPAWGEYAVIDRWTGTTKNFVFPSACDPDQFYLQDGAPFLPLGETGNIPKATSAKKIAQLRLGLSRLCGALNTEGYLQGDFVKATPTDLAKMPTVLPKFPALYYLFPEIDHDVVGSFTTISAPETTVVADKVGEYDHRQPGNDNFRPVSPTANPLVPATPNSVPPEVKGVTGTKLADVEPYVKDNYVRTAPKLGTGNPFSRLSAAVVVPKRTLTGITIASLANTTAVPATGGDFTSSYPNPNRTIVVDVDDHAVSTIALTPRRTDLADWKLPTGRLTDIQAAAAISGGPNIAPNYIMVPTGPNPTNTEPRSVPFLDRVIFDGRQLMAVRTLDVDLGMLRNSSKSLTSDVWLPTSGIIYAFREDAVREDAIMRPSSGTETNLADPANPTDPVVPVNATNRGIAVKSVDYIPDPERRPYGFRLRNGSQIKRKDGLIADKDNTRGLSFFTDQPVYIQGDFNLHQNGSDDTAGAQLEEFTELLLRDPGTKRYTNFYTRTTGDPRFANADPAITDASRKDRWRPSEILADSISLISNNFCDGSIADTFVIAKPATRPDFTALPNIAGGTTDQIDRSAYGGANVTTEVVSDFGLFGPGCVGNGYTSFHNQNRPDTALATNNEWVREAGSSSTLPQGINSYWADFTSPVKIDRRGNALVEASLATGTKPPPQPALPRPAIYDTSANYCPVGGSINQCRKLMAPTPTRVNTIIVSGVTPSRQNQSYGGLHNFPRFLENWGPDGATPFYINGSFLQLSFDNYSTGPFEQEGWEPGGGAVAAQENIPHYSPPGRVWGYDVGLQFSPAGPAASRFVTASSTRNEFYTEPPVNDPYINLLCSAMKTKVLDTYADVPANTKAKANCPQ